MTVSFQFLMIFFITTIILTYITACVGSMSAWYFLTPWIVKKVKHSIMTEQDGELNQAYDKVVGKFMSHVYKYIHSHPDEIKDIMFKSIKGDDKNGKNE